MIKRKFNSRPIIRLVLLGMAISINLVCFTNCSPVHEMSQTAAFNSVTDGGERFLSCNPNQIGNNSSQRLSKREYENTLRDLLGLVNSTIFTYDDGTNPTIQEYVNQLPSDISNLGKEDTALVDISHIDLYLKIAYAAGSRIASAHLGSIPGTAGCLSSATVTDACLTNFVNGFGIKAFRRPLTTAEVNLFKGYYNSSDFLDKQEKVTAVISIFLQSPDFIYRIYDRGNSNPDFSRTRMLTEYELASKVSYLVAGTMPDAELFSQAASGTLSTNLEAQVDRLLQTANARTSIGRFFVEWLRYNKFQNFADFPSSVLNGISITNLPQNMSKEVEDTINYVVFTQNGTYQDLMTTSASFVSSANLASVYGISNPNGQTNLGPNRSGILSRAAFLARKPATLTSPAVRGHFVLKDVLCEEIGSPPPGAPTTPDPLPPGVVLTTRDRAHYQTIQSQSGNIVTNCVGCHSRMNPFGYNYETFDPIGRIRPGNVEVVNGVSLPLNTTSETRELNGLNTQVSGYQDLHQKLGTSEKALSCMTQKWFDFVQKRHITSADNCYVNEVLETVYGTEEVGQGGIQDMIKKTILSDKFRYWKY